MIEVVSVVRRNKKAEQVTVKAGKVQVTYALGEDDRLVQLSRSCPDQVLNDQSLIISPADYRQAVKTASAILREKTRKARAK